MGTSEPLNLIDPQSHDSLLTNPQDIRPSDPQPPNLKKKKKRSKAPFRNFLTLFKKGHKFFLDEYIEDHPELRGILEHEEIKRIFDPKRLHISRFDYEILYKIDELKDCWAQMLQQKYLYQHLMFGRANLVQKQTYQSNIVRF
jgi:hypothetical protein